MAVGDADGARSAAERLERIERAEGERGSAHLLACQVLTVLWCMTHRRYLLPHERDLDRDVRSTPATWDRIRTAALTGLVEDIPIPSGTLRAWGLAKVLDGKGLMECRRWAPTALRAVERHWADSRDEVGSEDAVSQALVVAAHRRERLLEEYRPPCEAVPSVWHEAQQGARREDARVRVEILRRLDSMLARSPDPWTLACVALDRAATNDAIAVLKEQ